MGYGLEIYDANGKLVASSDQMSWVLRKTGTATTVATTIGGGGNSTPSMAVIDLAGLGYQNAIVAIACAQTMCFIATNTSGQMIYGCDGGVGTSFNYYIFDSSGTIPPANFGIEMYDANGNITFSSNQRMMKPLDVMYHDPAPSGPGGGLVGPNTTYPSPVTHTGKSLAVALTCWAGWYWLDPNSGVCYDTQPGVSWEPGMNCAFLQLQLSHNMIGGNITNSGQTASMGTVPWENLMLNTSSSQYKTARQQYTALTMLVIDVTNIPLGVTYY
jgi:hypothetical protein